MVLNNGNYLMALPNMRPVAVEVFALDGNQTVAHNGRMLSLAELLSAGYTFTPLVAMTPERVEALETVLNCADLGQGEYGDNAALGIVRAMLHEVAGQAPTEGQGGSE